MDVTQGGIPDATGGAARVTDQVGDRCQKLFQDFLEEWQQEEPRSSQRSSQTRDSKYLKLARELVKPERNTLNVSMKVINYVL